jgi:diguanylate cyclase (GGDEF)-like protein
MPVTCDFLAATVNTLSDQIAVIDMSGEILFVNHSWRVFGRDNNLNQEIDWIGRNYLQVCEQSATSGDHFAEQTCAGLRNLLNRESSHFDIEYPCDSPSEKRWFLMRADAFEHDGERYIVIAHCNITERKLAEERIKHLSRHDDLTALANRRYFDEWFSKEWRRCSRTQAPLSLAIIDIDFFKQLNDSLGHHAGDDCLKAISELLRAFTRRPNDICARYGGDEFILVYSNTGLEEAVEQMSKLREAVETLNIPNPHTPTGPQVTLSIGLATAYPDKESEPTRIIRMADNLLYAAKKGGRNCFEAAVMQV